MKLVVDIGSNTIKCMLGKAAGGGVETYMEESRNCRISAGGGELVPEAAEMISASIKAFQLRAHKEIDADFATIAVGTSALRSASNRDEVLKNVEDSTGVKIRVLSGKEEGRLSRLGASSDPVILALGRKVVFFDLGGGSLEITSDSSDGKGDFVASLPLGAVVLSKEFIKDINSRVLNYDRVAIAKKCADLFAPVVASMRRRAKSVFDKDCALVGTGGASSAARKISALYAGKDSPKVSDAQVKFALTRVSELGAKRRSEKFSISRSRAEIVPAAFVCIVELMKALGKTEFFHTFRNLRYGIILHADMLEHKAIDASATSKKCDSAQVKDLTSHDKVSQTKRTSPHTTLLRKVNPVALPQLSKDVRLDAAGIAKIIPIKVSKSSAKKFCK